MAFAKEDLSESLAAHNAWLRSSGHSGAQLNLEGEDLRGIDLSFEQLCGAKLSRANLSGAQLRATNLSAADSIHDFEASTETTGVLKSVPVDLSGANLTHAYMGGANLSHAILSDAVLATANINSVNFSGARLDGADLGEATVWNTSFINIDLSRTRGLSTCKHWGPSFLDYYSLQRAPNLPREFTKGCGLPEIYVDYLPSLTDVAPISFFTCFISYSSDDEEVASKLHGDLEEAGIRCWFAPRDLRTGDKFRREIDRSIAIHDKLLILLSKSSIPSPWVEAEVEAAYEKENRSNSLVLFPVRIDETAFSTSVAWASNIRRTRHIFDLTGWKEPDKYRGVLERLIRDLRVEPQR